MVNLIDWNVTVDADGKPVRLCFGDRAEDKSKALTDPEVAAAARALYEYQGTKASPREGTISGLNERTRALAAAVKKYEKAQRAVEGT